MTGLTGDVNLPHPPQYQFACNLLHNINLYDKPLWDKLCSSREFKALATKPPQFEVLAEEKDPARVVQKQLGEHKYSPLEKYKLLHWAVTKNDVKHNDAAQLIANSMDLHRLREFFFDTESNGALHFSILSQHFNVTQFLITHYSKLLSRDDIHFSFITLILYQQDQLARQLLPLNPSIHYRVKSTNLADYTFLQCAVLRVENWGFFNECLTLDPKVAVETHGETALSLAAKHNRRVALDAFIWNRQLLSQFSEKQLKLAAQHLVKNKNFSYLLLLMLQVPSLRKELQNYIEKIDLNLVDHWCRSGPFANEENETIASMAAQLNWNPIIRHILGLDEQPSLLYRFFNCCRRQKSANLLAKLTFAQASVFLFHLAVNERYDYARALIAKKPDIDRTKPMFVLLQKPIPPMVFIKELCAGNRYLAQEQKGETVYLVAVRHKHQEMMDDCLAKPILDQFSGEQLGKIAAILIQNQNFVYLEKMLNAISSPRIIVDLVNYLEKARKTIPAFCTGYFAPARHFWNKESVSEQWLVFIENVKNKILAKIINNGTFDGDKEAYEFMQHPRNTRLDFTEQFREAIKIVTTKGDSKEFKLAG